MPKGSSEMERKIRETPDAGIKRVGELLLNLELVPRLVDEDIRDGSSLVGNIDLAFELENRILLIEVSEQRENRTKRFYRGSKSGQVPIT